MPLVTLQFNLPDDNSAYELCHQAGYMYGALWDTAQEVFRPARKHGYNDPKIQALLEKLGEDGTELVNLLEIKFHEILRDNNVDLRKIG